MEKSEVGKSADGFIDRSKVRILLCDNDETCSQEVFTLLCKCSYQVTCVKSPRQVIDALNAEGPDIDIILSEVDLPMSKGLKMLKYIARDKELRRIPVIMMSAQDDVPVVVKCLKFGASDYLVKPLRTNELLNLWTHMWRRRRLLGLVEKNIVSYDFDMVVSDHSDGKTNSTTIFSDDTDEKSRKSTNLEMCVSTHHEDDINTATAVLLATAVEAAPQIPPDVPGISDRRRGQISSVPKKSELKIGESSAFFTYVKSVASKTEDQGASSVHERTPQNVKIMENTVPRGSEGFSKRIPETRSRSPENSNSVPGSYSMERSSTPPCSLDISQYGNDSQECPHIRTDPPNDAPGFIHGAYPYYFHGMMNRYNHLPPYVQSHAPNSPMLPPHYPHHIPQMPPPYAYYPFGVCVLPGQQPIHHPGPSLETPSSNEAQVVKIVDRREAALIKFRQKRKERCFDKKIRYVNRKKLAERRPRIRGQFVRKGSNSNSPDVDLSLPASVEDEEDESDDEVDFSPDDDDDK